MSMSYIGKMSVAGMPLLLQNCGLQRFNFRFHVCLPKSAWKSKAVVRFTAQYPFQCYEGPQGRRMAD